MQGFPGIGAEDRRLLEAAVRAAERAAEVHRERSSAAGAEEPAEKGRSDFVTEVDREAERRVVESLLEAFPDHAILAEEGARAGDPGEAPVRWIIDPLDGTTNWLHGYPEYSVSIAALDAGGIRAAVVLDSAGGERYEAVRGAGARRDGRPIRVSEVEELRLALVGTGFPFKKSEIVEGYLARFRRILERTSGIRRAGAASLDLCALACGRLDAFWEEWLMPWDVAAGALIVREAGGHFESLRLEGVPEGEPPAPETPELRAGAFLASNDRLRDAFRHLVLEG